MALVGGPPTEGYTTAAYTTAASPIAKRAAAAVALESYTAEEVAEERSFLGTVTSVTVTSVTLRLLQGDELVTLQKSLCPRVWRLAAACAVDYSTTQGTLEREFPAHWGHAPLLSGSILEKDYVPLDDLFTQVRTDTNINLACPHALLPDCCCLHDLLPAVLSASSLSLLAAFLSMSVPSRSVGTGYSAWPTTSRRLVASRTTTPATTMLTSTSQVFPMEEACFNTPENPGAARPGWASPGWASQRPAH